MDSRAEDRIAAVRAVMAAPQDVDLPDDVAEAAAALRDPAPHPDPQDDDHNYGGGDDGFDPPPFDPGPPEGEPGKIGLAALMPLNDFGNGQRFVLHFGDDLIFVPRIGWHGFDGCRFALDPDEIAVRRLAHQVSGLIEAEVPWIPVSDTEIEIMHAAEEAQKVLDEIGVIPVKDRTPDQIEVMAVKARLVADAKDLKDRRDKSIGRRLTHAKNAGNSNALKNMMIEASAIIARKMEDLDRHPLEINTLGGVLRFGTAPGEDDGGMNPPPPVVTVARFDHDRSQLLTKLMPVGLDPEARCPTFDAFLERIQPQAEMRRFLRRWFGYSMTGLTAEQKFAFFYGSGANGKSVLVDLMAKMMGDYAASAKIESITGRNRRGGGDATPDLMPLIGARFVRTSEPDEGQRLQEGLIKELTGGEPIMVRALNENFVLVYPIFKLTISGNHRPEIHGGDDGIWRRVMLVPFEVQIPPEERDPELGEKLWAERDGVMNWLIAGLREYLAHGLMVPEQVQAATEEYRKDSDPVASFLTQHCGVSGKPEHSIRTKDLAEAFAFWLEDTGQGAWTPRTISKRLKSKAGRWRHPATGQMFAPRKSSDSYFDGIELLEPFRSEFFAHQSRQSSGRGWQAKDNE